VGASVWSLGVIIERWWVFWRDSINFAKFLGELTRHLEAEDVASGYKLAQSMRSVESRVVLAGISRLAKGPLAVESAMTAEMVMEQSRLERGLIVLGTLGNNAPFIGLFGTVLGIIKAFNDLAVSGSSGVSVVMTGISSALIATAFGIFVAIPAVVANNYFHTKLRRISTNCKSLIHIIQVHTREEVGGHSTRYEPANLSLS
jgi:biopolymer transport protein ExbB/TolQ